MSGDIVRNRISIAMSGLGLICAFLAAPTASAQHNAPPGGPAQNNAPMTYYYFCQNSEVRPHAANYISPVVPRSVGVRALNTAAVDEDLKKTFGDFLAKKYGYAGTISCTNQPSKSWMETYRKNRIDLLRSSGYQVVEADWTDTQATSTPVPPSNPAAASAPAVGAYAPGTSLTYCLTPSSAQHVIYFSAVAPTNAAVTQGDREASFAAFLQKKYGYRTSTSCADTNMSTPQASKDYVTARQERISGYRSSRYTVVETDWTYGSSAAAPAASAAPVVPVRVAPPQPATPARNAATPRVITHPAAAPASSVPQTHYGICYGSPAGLPPTAYFSDPFEAPVPNVQAWSTTYRQVLRNQYKFMPNVHCSALKSLAEVQKMKDRMRVHWKIVETGWKNE
jgi:hypothetical protein